MYAIHMGIPEMKQIWEELQQKVKSGKANKEEDKLYRLMGKAMRFLSVDPKHPGL